FDLHFLQILWLFLFNIVKNKGVFGSIIPNTPYFSHTLFTIMPKYMPLYRNKLLSSERKLSS
ncbi:MAG: hypothetical protein U9Q66_04465, partial [Patescibacteria group bacterium]|nr:hypothetical protein [Patescibacteria group bacterium]